MADVVPRFEGFQDKVRASFAKQPAMTSLGIELSAVAPGRVELKMPRNADYCQQHGFLHAGILSTAMDSACGYAAFSLMEENAEVLTVEFKINLLAPADGESFLFVAEVVRHGRTLSFVECSAFSLKNKQRQKIATMAGTMMTILGRAGINA